MDPNSVVESSSRSNKSISERNPQNLLMRKVLKTIGKIVAFILAIWTFLIYFVSYKKSDTEIYFDMQGEQSGEPIKIIPTNGFYVFALGTKGFQDITVERVAIKFNPFEGIELLEDVEGTSVIRSANDRNLPVALCFENIFHLNANNLIVFGFSYSVKKELRQFMLEFETISRVSEWEFGFPFSMFPPGRKKNTKIVKFAPVDFDIKKGEEIRKYGLMHKPNKDYILHGEVAKKSMSTILEEGSPPTTIGLYPVRGK